MALEHAYNYLGITHKASNDEVNKAYKKLCLELHPDKEGGDEEEFKKLQIYISIISVARGETPVSEDDSQRSIACN